MPSITQNVERKRARFQDKVCIPKVAVNEYVCEDSHTEHILISISPEGQLASNEVPTAHAKWLVLIPVSLVAAKGNLVHPYTDL